MKPVAIAASACVALAALAGGGYFYAQGRAQSEIEATFAAIRATGATVAHGPISVNLWSRRFDVTDIIIKPAGAEGDITIGKLAVDGLDLWSRDFAASRLEVTSFQAILAGGATPDARTSVKAPTVVATTVRSTKALPAPDDPANADAVQRAMKVFGAFSAESVTAPTLEVASSVKLPPPTAGANPAAPVTLLTSYTNFKLEQIREGRIARGAFDAVTIKPDKSGILFSAKVNGGSVENIDIMPFFGIGLSSRTARDGFYAIQGKMTMGPYTISAIDGTEVVIGGFSASGMDLDPKKFGYGQLRQLTASMETMSARSTPAQQQELMGAVLGVYEGMRFDSFDVRDIKINGPKSARQPVAFTIGGVSMSKFARGKLGEIRVDNINGATRSPAGIVTPVKFGSLALRGFDMSKIVRISQEIAASVGPGKQPSPEKAYALASAIEGIEVIDVAVPDPRSGQTIQIDHFKVSWAQFVNDLPSKIALGFKGNAPLNPADPATAQLRSLGFQSLSLSADFSTDWDAASRIGTGAFAIDAQQLGGLSTAIKLGNVPRSAFSLVPGQLSAIMPDLELSGLQVKLRDNGLVQLARGALGGSSAADPLASIKQALVDPSKPPGNLSSILDGASRFLAEPGQALTISLQAKSRVPVSKFLSPGAFQAPDALSGMLDTFTADVAVTR